ncbi:MAG: acetyl/propionyl/methylcrotonyl-CoA carboxylase subunit alpha [Thermomicrobiales bacterium]
MSELGEGAISRVLVANRGEIALRVMRACRELGIATVAVYGPDEETACHVLYADDAYRLPDSAGIAYLDIEAIVAIARRAGADAVHPGYGFLAENAAFAESVVEAGLAFIGPRAETIGAMGDKVEARRIAIGAGVRPVPGTADPVESAAEAIAWAAEQGYPVAVKAAGGGGGRGFRVAHSQDEMQAAFDGSRGEAERYFANPTVYLERYLEHPRHIEVQVFGDLHGNVVAFPERDCSVQRRHQKLIEESPSPAVTPAIRQALPAATERLAQSVDYVGAGTVEFLLDDDGSFYFLEMNTLIQVEHTVTEMVTGIDLVAEQIRVAMGEPLSFGKDVAPHGWAIECRLNAEDSARQFAPVPGTISTYREPVGFGIRVESGFIGGGTISPAYDSLVAKLIAWGRTRDEALRRLQRALTDFEIGGVPTTISFHQRVLAHPAFLAGQATTTFIGDYPELLAAPATSAVEPTEGASHIARTTTDLIVEVDGRRFSVVVNAPAPTSPERTPARTMRQAKRSPAGAAHSSSNGNDLVSSVQGTVIRVAAVQGQSVAEGELVCVVEAMKMENEIVAHRSGKIAGLSVTPGQSIAAGSSVATIVDAAS